jgi:hypothetical protein
VYIEWNEKLFHELYRTYKEGRSEKDPSEFWYKGEIGFFDFYIIPLAMKLKTCGVFGVSSDEYLNYAMNNRNEWESKGKEAIKGFLQRYVEIELPALSEPPSKHSLLASKAVATVQLPPIRDISANQA